MQFGVAIKRMGVGDAIKTLAMGGYFKKVDNPGKSTNPEYPYQLISVNKDGVSGYYDMTESGEFAQQTTPAVLNLDPILLNQIAYGDWDVMTATKAEAERVNPKIW